MHLCTNTVFEHVLLKSDTQKFNNTILELAWKKNNLRNLRNKYGNEIVIYYKTPR